MQHGNTGNGTVGTKAPYFDGTQPCAQTDVDPDLFFPETPEEIYHNTRAAKTVCNSCAFIAPCLEYALSSDSGGIWAATTKTERRKIRKERGLPAPVSTLKLIDLLLK